MRPPCSLAYWYQSNKSLCGGDRINELETKRKDKRKFRINVCPFEILRLRYQWRIGILVVLSSLITTNSAGVLHLHVPNIDSRGTHCARPRPRLRWSCWLTLTKDLPSTPLVAHASIYFIRQSRTQAVDSCETISIWAVGNGVLTHDTSFDIVSS